MSIENFRAETRAWLSENCPESMRDRPVHFEDAFDIYNTDDARAWRDACAAKGWTAPLWPKEYGGAQMSADEYRVFQEEMAAIKALPPETGMGLAMIGPTLLEFGTEAQKQEHLPKIATGQVRWCQGYSEPGSGSDLASLQTKAVLEGDQFIINGQKIWTSGANNADWMFALVRTDPNASKHDGISFVLLDMHQPGVSVKPIPLISGSSPFCETFFDNAIALRSNLVGELNKGWTVGKRLLQYERSASPAPRRKKAVKSLNPYAQIAKQYLGETGGKVSDADAREKITQQVMLEKSMQLTVQRVSAETKSGRAPGATTSIFKLVGSTIAKESSALKSELRGLAGVGWEGDTFSEDELDATRGWLRDRAVTIYGGTNEVQMNIIAKRVLGLPD
ncbi:MAG: acyl-CoA dehydrogenase family protein [Pseudomonadales bacterium]|jgi:alkylation response protein AidB-like acyl-CoA dehydrogenase|nr:acyl-CoA dehydrogenase family protein [Pseudomonadales bacterium]MDA0762319.1 acyl-CoA dehydrogenase family protein [Pseudomonadota bacterium]MDA0957008.1 acyl-CoA dehydrogenase family protein [Pseudomonadota bacterium]MDA1208282.1 acyl-CoA dehydrogenase family protein [Pseudomonadota bacterium]